MADWDNWLRENAVERMDARRSDLFEQTRADFHSDRYRFACGYAQDARVLDVACGTGYGAATLMECGGASGVLGVDISADTVAYAEQTYARPGLRFVHAPAHRIPAADEAFDLVVSFETIEHIEEETEALEEWARVLRRGGRLVISTPNAWGLDDAPFHVRDYTPETLSDALSPRFEIVERWIQNSGTPNRRENHGMSRGIRESTADLEPRAECLLYVASRR